MIDLVSLTILRFGGCTRASTAEPELWVDLGTKAQRPSIFEYELRFGDSDACFDSFFECIQFAQQDFPIAVMQLWGVRAGGDDAGGDDRNRSTAKIWSQIVLGNDANDNSNIMQAAVGVSAQPP